MRCARRCILTLTLTLTLTLSRAEKTHGRGEIFLRIRNNPPSPAPLFRVGGLG